MVFDVEYTKASIRFEPPRLIAGNPSTGGCSQSHSSAQLGYAREHPRARCKSVAVRSAPLRADEARARTRRPKPVNHIRGSSCAEMHYEYSTGYMPGMAALESIIHSRSDIGPGSRLPRQNRVGRGGRPTAKRTRFPDASCFISDGPGKNTGETARMNEESRRALVIFNMKISETSSEDFARLLRRELAGYLICFKCAIVMATYLLCIKANCTNEIKKIQKVLIPSLEVLGKLDKSCRMKCKKSV